MLSADQRRFWGVPAAGPWSRWGACRGMSPEVFIPPDLDDAEADLAAKRVCAGCVVVGDCRTYGLRWDLVGVWGGWNGQDRAAYRRELAARRGRRRIEVLTISNDRSRTEEAV